MRPNFDRVWSPVGSWSRDSGETPSGLVDLERTSSNSRVLAFLCKKKKKVGTHSRDSWEFVPLKIGRLCSSLKSQTKLDGCCLATTTYGICEQLPPIRMIIWCASQSISPQNIAWAFSLTYIGPVRLSYNPYFLACFFNRNSVFLSKQIRWNNVSACFFNEANGALESSWLGPWRWYYAQLVTK